MKTTKLIVYITFLLSLITINSARAVQVNIPDANFRDYLKVNYPACFVGDKMETSCTDIVNETKLYLMNENINTLTGLEYFVNLKILYCNNNNLKNLPSLPATLIELDCHFNQISNLPPLPASLQTLICSNNKLTSLPTLPPSLSVLYCQSNQISNLPTLPANLNFLNCTYNYIICLPNIPPSPNFTSTCGVTVCSNLVNIPDANFRAFLKLKYPSCFVGELMDKSCSGIVNEVFLDVSSKNISDLTGIEYFVNLGTLYCNNNKLTTLPPLPSTLTGLACRQNQLNILPALPASLIDFDCQYNKLSSLPKLPATLTSIFCNDNQLTSLPDLPDGITDLYCGNNKLDRMPALPAALTNLNCNKNNLSALPALPASLTYLYCENNALTDLPILPTSLRALNCIGNKIICLPNIPNPYFYNSCGLTLCPSIKASVINPVSYCLNGTVYIPFTINSAYKNNNTFTAQLSDASGSFTNTVTIGTLNSSTSGTITGTIPASTIPGNGYRIRVVSSSPVINGTDNGTNLTVLPPPTNLVINGASVVNQSQTGVTYSVTNNPGSTYTWTVPFGATLASGNGTANIVVNYGANSGSVTVVETNSNGCKGNLASLNISLISPNAGTVVSDQNKNSYCYGENASLSIVGFKGSIIFQYSTDGINYTNSDNGGPNINITKPTGNGRLVIYYRALAVQFKLGKLTTVYSNPFAVTFSNSVNPSTISIDPINLQGSVCAGSAITIPTTINGNYDKIEWYESIDGTTFNVISGQNQSALNYGTDAAITSDQIKYFKAKVLISGCNGIFVNESAIAKRLIKVQNVAFQITPNLSPRYVCSNTAVTFVTQNLNNVALQWWSSSNPTTDFTPINGATNISYGEMVVNNGTTPISKYYKVQFGTTCPAFAKPKQIIVEPAVVAGYIEGPTTASGSYTLTLKNNVGSNIHWLFQTSGTDTWVDFGTVNQQSISPNFLAKWMVSLSTGDANSIKCTANTAPFEVKAALPQLNVTGLTCDYIFSGDYVYLTPDAGYDSYDWQILNPGSSDYEDFGTIYTADGDIQMWFPLANYDQDIEQYKFKVTGNKADGTKATSSEIVINVYPNPFNNPNIKRGRACAGETRDLTLLANKNFDAMEVAYMFSSQSDWTLMTGVNDKYTTPQIYEDITVRVRYYKTLCGNKYTEQSYKIESGNPKAGYITGPATMVCPVNSGYAYNLTLNDYKGQTIRWYYLIESGDGRWYYNISNDNKTVIGDNMTYTYKAMVGYPECNAYLYTDTIHPKVYNAPSLQASAVTNYCSHYMSGETPIQINSVFNVPGNFYTETGNYEWEFHYPDNSISTIFSTDPTIYFPVNPVTRDYEDRYDFRVTAHHKYCPITSAFNYFEINPQPADFLSIPSTVQAGVPFNLTVQRLSYYYVYVKYSFDNTNWSDASDLGNEQYGFPAIQGKIRVWIRHELFEDCLGKNFVDNYYAIDPSGTSLKMSNSGNVGTASTIELYPNPTQQEFSINAKGMESHVNVIITDLQGKKIFEGNYSNNNSIDGLGADLPNGTYIVSVSDSSSKRQQLLVKSK